jgi:hypothetical protein
MRRACPAFSLSYRSKYWEKARLPMRDNLSQFRNPNAVVGSQSMAEAINPTHDYKHLYLRISYFFDRSHYFLYTSTAIIFFFGSLFSNLQLVREFLFELLLASIRTVYLKSFKT